MASSTATTRAVVEMNERVVKTTSCNRPRFSSTLDGEVSVA
jgi:hypothetical protein